MKRIMSFALLSIYFGAIGTIVTNNVMFGIVIFAVFFLTSLLIIGPLTKRSEAKGRKRHEVFHFINDFIISLTITSSIEQAFEDATLEVKGEEKEVLESVSHLTIPERLEYLALYFDEDIYRVFLSIVKVYQEEGGNLLDIASPLLDEAALNEEKHNAIDTHKKKSIIQYISMWFLSSLILCFLRYGLSSFYDMVAKSLPYLLTASAYFLIAIISFCVYARTYCDAKLVLKKETK